MQSRVKEVAEKKWSNYPFRRLVELKRGEMCWTLGTLYKKMDLKPSILKEISADHRVLPQPARAKYVATSDELIVEDTVSRVVLTGSIAKDELVTGIIIGIFGEETNNGLFEVKDHCFADLSFPALASVPKGLNEDKYVVLVSGLNLGSPWCDRVSIEMFVDYVTGQLGAHKDMEFCSHIVRVIVAGNAITDKPTKTATVKDTKTKYLSRNYSADTIDAMKELDDVLAQLASCVPVDLMPGSHDPTNYHIPQQPLHKCMFPQASRFNNLTGVTNPYMASLDGLRFLGTSGQNVDDIFKFCTLTDRLEVLHRTLQWSHMAPTAPDTLGCYPYADDDPFVLSECPHVYFAANQPAFQCKKASKGNGSVLLVAVPNFDVTHSCALVNLRTLECVEMSFSTSLHRGDHPEQMQLLVSQQSNDIVQDSQPPEDNEFNLFDQDESDDDMD
eukprot:Em0020g85a